jgi:uncharacterized protein YkwD
VRTRGRIDVIAVVAALAVLAVGWKFELGRYVPFAGAVPAAVRPHHGQRLYAANDSWTAWLAPESTCPGGERTDRAPEVQLTTMLCLVNFARQRQGLGTVGLTTQLNVAAAAKATDIARCGRYQHAACGKPPDQDAIDAGYAGAWGENLDLAEGPLAAPRVAMDEWLNSPHHRENLFRPDWRTAGLALMPGVDVDGFHDAVLWVSEFGDR